jgi:DNA-binding transcriptional regulator GbsR (MarR family)
MIEIANATGVSRQSSSSSLKKLADGGFIDCESRLICGVYVNFYRFRRNIK